jgi:putative inorganic carbon (hco3(-)) transporter
VTKILLYIFLFLLPLRNIVEKIPNLYGIPGLGSTHVLFLIAFVAAFITTGEKSLFDRPKLSLPIILFLAYLLFESLITDPFITPLDYRITVWKDQLLLMGVYFIVLRGFRRKSEILIALAAMCLANVYMDIYFWRWVRWMSFDNFADKMKDVNGTFGTVGGSNEWAAFFSTYTPLLFAVLPAIRQQASKLLCGGLAIANVIVLLFTFSRGAYVGILAALLWYILMMRKFLWIIGLVVLFAGYSFLLPQAVVDRIEMTGQVSEYGEIQDQDVNSRLAMWDYALDLFKRSPLIGHGSQSFQYGHWNNPHNQHLYILAELGCIGYLLFLWLFWVSYREAGKLRAIGADDFGQRFALGIQLSVVALFVANFFGNRWTYSPLMSYFWAINAMCHRYLILAQEGNMERQQQQ